MTPAATPIAITPDVGYVDVRYHGHPRCIACGVLRTGDGLAIVDPGPAVSLDTLDAGLAPWGGLSAVRFVLLTHIHLDHAGATGVIAGRVPEARVYVHAVGAPHMISPERLLRSARRLYGDRMDALWGAFLPVDAGRVEVLRGGETLDVGGRRIEVIYTPGHASHHVCYLDAASGTAYVGDTAGMRVAGVDYVVPVTPPPDVDLDLWPESLDRIRAWNPDRLFLTHFGPSEDVGAHLDTMERELDRFGRMVRDTLQEDATDEERAAAFARAFRDRAPHDLSPEDRDPYTRFGQPEPSWHGIARYWRKREES